MYYTLKKQGTPLPDVLKFRNFSFKSYYTGRIYELVGEVVPYHYGVGEEGIFKIVCSCRALLICIVGVFARCGV